MCALTWNWPANSEGDPVPLVGDVTLSETGRKSWKEEDEEYNDGAENSEHGSQLAIGQDCEEYRGRHDDLGESNEERLNTQRRKPSDR